MAVALVPTLYTEIAGLPCTFDGGCKATVTLFRPRFLLRDISRFRDWE